MGDIINNLTSSTVKLLLNQEQTTPVVTIYLPTHRGASPPHMQQDQIRFKNLMNQAIKIVKERGDEEFAQFIASKQDEILQDTPFWEQRTEGLFIGIRPSVFAALRMPIECEEYIAVDTRYHLAPIYGILHDKAHYYILVLAQHNPSLYHGNSFDIYESSTELPSSLEEALHIDEMYQERESLQFSTIAGGAGAEFHGHGGAKDSGDNERLRFFKIIDETVYQAADRRLPLILAGTESEVAEYKHISRFPHILDGFIAGNHTREHPHSLLPAAREIVDREIIERDHQQALKQFDRHKRKRGGRVLTEPVAIEDAAEKGQVQTLLLASLDKTHDTVSDKTTRISKLVFPDAYAQVSTDRISQQVWSQGGTIINLYQDQLPPTTPVMALLRYAVEQ